MMSGRKVLITGASRGIGAATAEAFAAQGDHVVVHCFRSTERAVEVVQRCRTYGVTSFAVSADLRQRQGVEMLAAELLAVDFWPDVLVNNAGTVQSGLFQQITYEVWYEMVMLHMGASFFCTQHFLPHMIRQRFGRIVNLSSVWAERGAAMETLYAMVKGGINAWTKGLAKEVASAGVTVNAVAPGAIETEMNAFLSAEEREELRMEIPLLRLGTPSEVAAVITFLASKQASYVTGQVVSPNGGWF